MNMQKILALISLLVTTLLISGCGGNGTCLGGGETLDSAFTGPTNTEFSCYNGDTYRFELAQSFLAGSNRYITKVSFNVYRTGAGEGTYTVDIQGDSGGLPSRVPLGTSNPIATASLSPTAAWQDFTFATPVTCSYGQTYWLVLRKVGGVNNAGEGLAAKANTNPNSYTGGRLVSEAMNGTWQETGGDALFRIYSRTRL